MKLLAQDTRDGHMKIEVESDADLWHLDHVIGAGDRLRMRDQRTTIEGDTKQSAVLTLEVEKTEYQGGRLRATGEISDGPENIQRGYHTFNLEQGVTFDIWKDVWREYELDRIRQAVDTDDYAVLVCTIDKENAYFARITETGISPLSEIDSDHSGKMYKTDAASEQEFYGQAAAILRKHDDVDAIILAGPGFEKDNLKEFIAENAPEIADLVRTEGVSTTGTAGVQEVIKRGAIKQVLHDSRISDEVAAVEDLLEHLNMDDGLAVYGMDRVEHAVELGAIETLLITDQLLRQHSELADRTEQRQGTIRIVHEDHDAGKKLASLGGVAAILRYPIE